jgi:DNA-3-methyladenine glycosylase II
MTTLTITPEGAFSLDAAAHFGFGPNSGRPSRDDGRMTLAFPADDFASYVRVDLAQDAAGPLTAAVDVHGEADLPGVEAQVRRILSLDHSGADWARVGERDAVVGRLQATHPGLRPVLFHSPYEAAAWSIISARRQRAQGAVIRARISRLAGHVFEDDGAGALAFPTPDALLSLSEVQGLDSVRIERLHAVAHAALDGLLAPARLLAMDTEEALLDLQKLPGIGPMYSTLILLRSTGAVDSLTGLEPRLASYLAHFYESDRTTLSDEEIVEIAEGWRPFRTWTAVLVRAAGEALGLPVPESASFARRPRA